MNILVISEDFQYDWLILEPVIQKMMSVKGKPKARIKPYQNPSPFGVSKATNWERIEEVIEQYKGMVNLFLLCVDRDCKPGRRQQLDRIEAMAAQLLQDDQQFLAENAWQEIEVWVLAGLDLPTEWRWQEIREKECDPKETYFEPLAAQRNLFNEPGGGRKTLAKEAAKRYGRICKLSPEVTELEKRINI